MENTIRIGDKDVRLSNNVAWTMEYKDQFGKDILPAIMPLFASVLESAAALFENKNGSLTAADILESVQGRAVDILLPMFQAEFVDLVVNVTWAMAKAADESIDPPKKWVKQFDSFPFDEIVPELWKMNAEGFSSSKNLNRLRTLLGKAREAWDEMQKDEETQPASESTK